MEELSIAKFLILSASLIIVGFFITLALFKFDLKKLLASYLTVKILMWIPITALALVIYLVNSEFKFIILLIIAAVILIEGLKVIKKGNTILYLYPLLIVLGLFFSIWFSQKLYFNNILLTLIFSVSISDVFAFFFGNFFGYHKLPEFINSNKSWEGFLGEIIGALIGLFLLRLVFQNPFSAVLFIPIGLGAGIGDLVNSYFKRKLGIKNWSLAIPGHGGFIDRLCGISFAFIFTFLFAYLFWF